MLLSFTSQQMNRPENVFYNFDQSAPTAPNENAEGDFVGTAEKLATTMTNPMNSPSYNIPAIRPHAAMMDDTTIRPSTSKPKSQAGAITTSSNPNEPMPKRNLSSYNLFFQVERENIIKGEEGIQESILIHTKSRLFLTYIGKLTYCCCRRCRGCRSCGDC